MKIRKKIKGNKDRLRLSVFKSNKNLYVQIIDDEKGVTVVSASTLTEKDLSKNSEGAKKLGEIIATKSKDKKINQLVFDRGRYPFKRILKVLADSIIENGVTFKKDKKNAS